MMVALFTDGLWPYKMGGMQKHSFYLAKFLAGSQIKTSVYFPCTELALREKPLDDFFSEEERRYLVFNYLPEVKEAQFPGHYIYDCYQYSKTVFEKYSKRDVIPDLVYIQGFSGWKLLQEFRKNNIKIPTIINFHGLEMFQKPASLKSKLINIYLKPFVLINLRLATKVQSLGGQLTHILEKVIRDRTKIIELGIGVDASWVGQHKNEIGTVRNFVFLGRYERRKGIEELTKVLRKLIQEEKFKATFDFIGPIPENKKINHPSISYHGLILEPEKINSLLQKADVLVCPSYSEGMPTVILEAMASGCAIIATDVGAVAELVSPKNGWLIEAGNINTLFEAMLNAIHLDSDTLYEKKNKSVKIVRENYLWDKVSKKMIGVFSSISENN